MAEAPTLSLINSQSSQQPVSSTRHLVGWYLFEIGTSILMFNGGLYFSQWLVIDNKVNDWWYNGSLIFSTFIVLALAPVLGAYSDRKFGRKIFLILLSVAMFLGVVAISFADKVVQAKPARVSLALAGFIGAI